MVRLSNLQTSTNYTRSHTWRHVLHWLTATGGSGGTDDQDSDSDSSVDANDEGPPPEWHKRVPRFAWKILAGMDYIGEHIADFLGITTPKYQWVIGEPPPSS